MLTLGSVTVALLISFVLPGVEQSIYFYRNDSNSNLGSNYGATAGGSDSNHNQGVATLQKLSFRQRVKRAYSILWIDFTRAYSNSYVLKWSVWWAIASAGYYQV